jgi:S1-C subfamily serine protease
MKKKRQNTFTRDLVECLVIGVIIGGIGILGILQYQKFQAEKIKEQIIKSDLDYRFYQIEEQIKELDKSLTEQIMQLPRVMELHKKIIELRLRQAIVVIFNNTVGAQGSGVTIKYKDNFYILTAGHMLDNSDDNLTFSENGQEIGKLEVVKWDYTWTDEVPDSGLSKVHDLLLLKPKNYNLRPRFYVELADEEPIVSEEIYIVGTPVGIEDVLCEGRIIKYKDNFIYYIDHTYYGNSGGGLFTEDGKLIGIVSHMYPIYANEFIPPYMIYGATRLNVIKDFLEGVE